MTRRPPDARPLRVAHVITKLAVGGAQESVLVTCAGIDRTRVEQVLLSGTEADSEGSLLDTARDLGIEVELVPALQRSIRPVADGRAVVDLARRLRRGRYDVVHTHSSKAGLVGRLAARLAGVPTVVHSVHGWSFNDDMRPALRRLVVTLERLAAPLTDRLVVEATPDREKGLRAKIGTPAKYVLIRNGIDVAALSRTPDAVAAGRARVRAELGIDPAARVIGTVGRLADQKDPLAMADAFATLVATVPDARFVWVGDGPLRADLEAHLDRLGIADRFTIAGVRRDVPDVLAALDVFALSSRWEGLPRTITEAMAVGIPVAGYAVDGVAEIIDDRETGRLVEPGDVAGLAKAIGELVEDRELADRCRTQAGERVTAWDRSAMLAQLEALYVTSAAAHGSAGDAWPAPARLGWWRRSGHRTHVGR